MNETYCEDCGVFLNSGNEQGSFKCHDCFEEEMIKAVEADIIPDGMTHMAFLDIQRKYSEPQLAYRE